MARADLLGMFWDDRPPPKPPRKEKVKAVPPEPVWLNPEYLPNLEKATAWQPNVFTDAELIQASVNKETLVWDIECYPNYFVVAFMSVVSKKVIWFEMHAGMEHLMDYSKLAWVLQNFTLVDYNGDHYDVPIVSIALNYATCEVLYAATLAIIAEETRPQDVLKRFRSKKFKIDHIDLIELVALSPSLKLLAGRLHAAQMQDLPFNPGTILSFKQKLILRWYCVNDLKNTYLLFNELTPDIKLREKMSLRYGVDLRSHSDAQIAEAVITSEIKKITGRQYLSKPVIEPGTIYKYEPPHFLKYSTKLMNWVLSQVVGADFEVAMDGTIIEPRDLTDLEIRIANGVYRIGIGGLHSSEKNIAHIAGDDEKLSDRDVASFYPKIILLLGLAPAHLGYHFLNVYNSLVIERLAAKNAGDKTTADSLKIVVNGSYGKLGNVWSTLYSPNLLIQVTLTGQLSLLMLIERLELAGISVVSANTDGVVLKYKLAQENLVNSIVSQWEKDTGFETEETVYSGLYSRDVNNYYAVKRSGGNPKGKYLNERLGVKVKGIFAELGSSRNSILSKNPTVLVCSDAVSTYLATGKPVKNTILECKELCRFGFVRTVKGGAVKVWEDGRIEYLGKAIRWYYAKGETGNLIYAKSGNKVPRSDGAKPLMDLEIPFPNDIDYDWYIREAEKILHQIGHPNYLHIIEE